MMGLVPYKKRLESLFFLCHVRIKKLAIFKVGNGLSPGPGHASTLILELPVFRTMKNNCLLFKPTHPYHFIIAATVKRAG